MKNWKKSAQVKLYLDVKEKTQISIFQTVKNTIYRDFFKWFSTLTFIYLIFEGWQNNIVTNIYIGTMILLFSFTAKNFYFLNRTKKQWFIKFKKEKEKYKNTYYPDEDYTDGITLESRAHKLEKRFCPVCQSDLFYLPPHRIWCSNDWCNYHELLANSLEGAMEIRTDNIKPPMVREIPERSTIIDIDDFSTHSVKVFRSKNSAKYSKTSLKYNNPELFNYPLLPKDSYKVIKDKERLK